MRAITPEYCEYYTPQYILEKVYATFDVDLDPCAPAQCKPVKAKSYYTQDTDGLRHEWFGNVFINPPYGKELKNWINKLSDEVSREGTKCNYTLSKQDRHQMVSGS